MNSSKDNDSMTSNVNQNNGYISSNIAGINPQNGMSNIGTNNFSESVAGTNSSVSNKVLETQNSQIYNNEILANTQSINNQNFNGNSVNNLQPNIVMPPNNFEKEMVNGISPNLSGNVVNQNTSNYTNNINNASFQNNINDVKPEITGSVNYIQPEINNRNFNGINQSSGMEVNNMNFTGPSSYDNQNTTNEFVGSSPEKKSFNKLFIIVPVAAIILLISAGLVYRFYFNNPYNIMSNSFEVISDKYEEISDLLLLDYDLEEDLMQLNLDATLNVVEDTSGTLTEYDGLNIALSMGLDYSNNDLVLNAKVNDSSENLLNINTEYINESIYLDLVDIYDYVLYTNLEESLSFSEMLDSDALTNIEYSEIADILFDNYLEILDKNNTTTEKITIDYFGESKEVTKTTFIYDEEAYNRLIDCLVNSETFVNLLADTYGYTTDEIITLLNDGSLIAYTSGELNFSVYTSGIFNKCVGYSFSENENIIILNDGNQGQITLKEAYNGEDIIIEFTNKIDEINYSFEIGEEIQNINGTITNKKLTLNFEVEGVFYGVVYNITESNDTLVSDNLVLSMSYSDSVDTIDLELIINSEKEIVSSLDNVDTNNVQNIEDLTDEELQTIIDNINVKVEGTILESYVSELTSGLIVDYSDFVTDAQTILSAGATAMDYMDEDCLTIYNLYSNDYISYDLYWDYYGKVVYDEDAEEYTLYLYDLENEIVIAGVTYSKYESISENDITEYDYSNEYYSCTN